LTLLAVLAGSELAVYTVAALTSGPSQLMIGGVTTGDGGGGDSGEGDGGGEGDGEATAPSAHWNAEASSWLHRSGLSGLSTHMRILPAHTPSDARWPKSAQLYLVRSSQ
jgi:hypothetical protein